MRSLTRSPARTGMDVRWEHFVNSFAGSAQLSTYPGAGLESHAGKHAMYVRELASIVSTFQDRTDSLVEIYSDISHTIDQLATCPYTTEAFSAHLTSIQRTIDKLNLEGYANLDAWVAELDAKIELILVSRLRKVIDRWCAEFNKDGDNAMTNGDTSVSLRRKKVEKEAPVSEYSRVLLDNSAHRPRTGRPGCRSRARVCHA